MIGLSYEKMSRFLRKGVRNGNWHDLSQNEKGLFRAAKWCIKKGLKVIGRVPLRNLLSVIKKLTSSLKRDIWQRGAKEASRLQRRLESSDVFEWCPQARKWLRDPDYIFYLGVCPLSFGSRRSNPHRPRKEKAPDGDGNT